MNYKVIKAGTEDFDGEDAIIEEYPDRVDPKVAEADRAYFATHTEANDVAMAKAAIARGNANHPVVKAEIARLKRSGAWARYETSEDAAQVAAHEAEGDAAYNPADFVHLR